MTNSRAHARLPGPLPPPSHKHGVNESMNTPQTVCLQLKKRRDNELDSQTYRRPACPQQDPMCTDQDWGPGCPSGCTLQALLLQKEQEMERRMLTVCEGVQLRHLTSLSALSSCTVLYYAQRRALRAQRDRELRYVAQADQLARKLRLLRRRSSALSRRLKELRQKVQEQMEETYRTEVDVDMKIRACQGSCSSRLAFRIQEEEDLDLPSAAPPPPRKELPHILTSDLRGQSRQLEPFGDVEENRLVVRAAPPRPEDPDL